MRVAQALVKAVKQSVAPLSERRLLAAVTFERRLVQNPGREPLPLEDASFRLPRS